MVNINSFSALSGTQNQQNIQRANAKLQAVIASLVSGSRLNQASDDVAALSIATQLQSSVTGLKQVSSNLAQASSVVQVADGGVSQIQSVLQELQKVAQQAGSPTLNDETRVALNEQFQQLKQQIDQIAGTTGFNNQKLLNGDLSGAGALSLDSLLSAEVGGEPIELSIAGLSSSALFGGENLNVLSAASAQQATISISQAINQTVGVRADIGAFQQSVNFASANIDSAVYNQQAALSSLADADFADAATQLSLANLQKNFSTALAAQGNNLTPTLLKLVS